MGSRLRIPSVERGWRNYDQSQADNHSSTIIAEDLEVAALILSERELQHQAQMSLMDGE